MVSNSEAPIRMAAWERKGVELGTEGFAEGRTTY
jgi:hypothetical protein